MLRINQRLTTIALTSLVSSLTSVLSSAQEQPAPTPRRAAPAPTQPEATASIAVPAPSAAAAAGTTSATTESAARTAVEPIAATPTVEPGATDGVPAAPSEPPPAEPAKSEATAAAELTSEEAESNPIRDHVKLGGGAIIYYYQPTKEGRGNVSVFFANLLLDAQWQNFGLHLEPRFRDTKLRPFFDGPAWLQEAYASYSLAPITIKLGKVYKRSGGLFWDNSFFGNVQVYDGLKLDPNYGVSVEGSVGSTFGLDFAAQYFVVDGLTNVSLQGRDTFSTPGARRRHTKAAKVEPWVKLGTLGEVRVGGSIEHFIADIPENHDEVVRGGADLKATFDFGAAGSAGAWGEFIHQSGSHVVDHPLAGSPSDNTNYFLAGAQYTFWKFTARYNVSHANYKSVDVKETLHVPGLGIAIHENLTLLGELAHWRQYTPNGKVPYNDSVNVTLSGRF